MRMSSNVQKHCHYVQNEAANYVGNYQRRMNRQRGNYQGGPNQSQGSLPQQWLNNQGLNNNHGNQGWNSNSQGGNRRVWSSQTTNGQRPHMYQQSNHSLRLPTIKGNRQFP